MLRAMLAVALVAAVVPVAVASDFYKGRTLKVIVGASTGGGYDSYARLIARHMPRHLPGEPTIVVQNMPGADGIIAANHLFNLADKDGTVIGTFNRYVPLMPLLGNKQAKLRPEQFNWIGTTSSYSDNSYVLVIRAALPHRSVADLRDPARAVHIGHVDSDVPMVLQEAFRLNFRIIGGYKGKDDMELAFERGEVDGHMLGWTSILSRHEQWLSSGFIRPMIQFGRLDRLPELKDVPTARELATTAEDRDLIELAELPLLMARPFAAPPGVPADRVELLRKAFAATVRDPAYLEEGNRQKLELTPKDGQEIDALVASLARTSGAAVERYKKALGGRAPSGG